MRIVFLAEPVDDTPPKNEPDEESLEAAWVSLDELARYPLRGDEVGELFAYVAAGGAIFPTSIIQTRSLATTPRPSCNSDSRHAPAAGRSGSAL